MIRRSLALAIALPACAHGNVADRPPSPLPVTRVVLYQNGIGYFERGGSFSGETLRLAVRPQQINDMLSSLTVIDRSGSQSPSVSLPIDKSAAQRLDDLPPQVREKGGMISLLHAFRGARVVIDNDNGSSTEGRVVGVQEQGKGQFLAVAAGEHIDNIPIEGIRTLRLLDRPLQVGLDKVLDHSLNQGSWKPVELSLNFERSGRHDLMMSYITEMPTWKPAYRLVLGKPDEKALLQGWAVIDNTSGEDWRNVKVSLSSGAPISFVYDLHKPHFVRRPRVGVRHGSAGAPVASAEAVRAPSAAERARPSRAKRSRPRASSRMASVGDAFGSMVGGAAPAAEMDDEVASISLDEMAAASGASVEGQAISGLFRYDLPGRVTVPDRSSTLVNLVNSRLAGDDLLLFRPELGGKARQHPYRSVRFTNDTGMTLQGGPVTVLSRGTFVGSGVFDRIESGAETYLPFSMEQGVSVSQARSHEEDAVKLVAIVDGRLTIKTQSRQVYKYEVERRAEDSPETMVLRIPKASDWKLLEAPKGTRELHGSWYIPMPLKLGKNTAQYVVAKDGKRQVQWTHHLAGPALSLYVKSPDALPELKEALAKVDALDQTIRRLNEEASQAQGRKAVLSREQQRLRRNIETLGKAKINRKLAEDMARRLGEAEQAIAKLNAELVRIDQALHDAKAQLRVLISEIKL